MKVLYAISMRFLGQKWLKTRMDIAYLVLGICSIPFALSVSKCICEQSRASPASLPRSRRSARMVLQLAKRSAGLCAALLLCGFAHAQTPALDQARALIAQRQFVQAETLLRPQTEGPIRDTLLAQALMGLREGGLSTNNDRVTEALTLLQRAASAGYPEATYPLATILASSGRVTEAQQLLAPLTAQSDARALYLVGRIAEASREYLRAAQFYERNAHRGNADAFNNLGYLHANGLGVARDDGRAAQYYRDAVAAGSIEAGINLVALADAGRTQLATNESRTALLERAAQMGQPTALRMLGRSAPAPIATAPAPSVPAPVAPAAASARAATPAALVSGAAVSTTSSASAAPPPTAPQRPASPPAAVAAATATATAPPSAPAPAPLTAAQAADLYAQALRLQRGEGAVRDLAKAAALLEQAAAAGLPDAQRTLADVYDYGLGVVSNPRKALELRKAAAGR
jgi:TPR repeat protein